MSIQYEKILREIYDILDPEFAPDYVREREERIAAYMNKDNFYMIGYELVRPTDIATVAAGPERTLSHDLKFEI